MAAPRPSGGTLAEMFRYVVSGGLSFVVDFATLYVGTEYFGLHYLASNALGYATGLAVAYTLNVRWVFNHRRIQRTWLELLIFNAMLLVGLGISEGILAWLVEGAGVYYLHAKFAAGFFLMVFNYVTRKYVLFSPAPAGRGA